MELISLVRNDMDMSVPIIIIAPLEDENIILEAMQKGADDFVTKPFKPVELVCASPYISGYCFTGWLSRLILGPSQFINPFYPAKPRISKKQGEDGQPKSLLMKELSWREVWGRACPPYPGGEQTTHASL